MVEKQFLELNFTEDTVHYPIDTGGTDAVGGADAMMLQVLNNATDEW